MRLNEEEQYLRDGMKTNTDKLREKFEVTSKRLDTDLAIMQSIIDSKEKSLDTLKVQRAGGQPAEVSLNFIVSEYSIA